MTRRPRFVFLGLFLATVLWGCATHGANFRLEDARRVELGMTKTQVVDIMGSEPSDVHEDMTGELWMWNRVVVTIVSSESKSFAVKFKDGKVVWINR